MRHLKQEFDKLSFKETLTYMLAFVSQIVGFIMLFMGMLMPPAGEIHDSVLTAFGLILLFVSSILGISMHYNNRDKAFRQAVTNILVKSGIPKEAIKEETDGENG